MSDFDEVLERLVNEPGFKAALAANPQAALAGYQLDPEERGLLGVEFVAGEGEERTVELRANKSGVVGLVGPVAAAFGVAVGGAATTGVPSSGAVSGAQAFGLAPGTPVQGMGGAALETFGGVKDGGSLSGTETFGQASASEGSTERVGVASGGAHLGAAPDDAAGYHTRVDVDGDGSWDAHTTYERADGGVDIVADSDGDGQADFVGHDYDRDGLVDVAEFDNDGNGSLETRMYDDDGDGWMDREEPIQAPGPIEGFGAAPRT